MGNNPSINIGDKLPVHNINFFDAQNFCNKLNELTKDKRPAGYEFDIPSEEQWEYACRAGNITSLNNGKNLQNANSTDNELNKIGWYKINACEKVQTVGKRTANAWGLHDMLGNVWEWCKISNSSDQTKAIIRGGSFKSNASDCRNASRNEVESSKTKEDYGFRIILKAKN
jgi:formylglycine-generating enzyme required for sulfatase activity